MFNLIFGVVIIILGIKEIANRNNTKGYERYTQESVTKYRPIVGVVLIVFGAFQILLGLIGQQIISINLFENIDKMVLQLIVVGIIAVIMLIAYFTILKKDPKATAAKHNEDEDED